MLPDEIFRQGSLLMSDQPLQSTVNALPWSQCLTNRIVMAVAIVLLLIDLVDLLSIFPAITHNFKTSRGAISLEHSVSVARSRNISAALMTIPFCMMCDRYALYPAGFLQAMPYGISLAATAGVLVAFLLVRHIIHMLVARPRRHDQEKAHAVHRVMYTFFIVLVILMLLTVAFGVVKKAPDASIRRVLQWEMIAVYAFAFFREGQILAANCNGFSTILYLCALELMPMGLLIASAIVF
ncbi:MAG: hypothetical protein MJY91_09175 [Bacteroidales bacterium]|nr:hypothetical protein [Bacteroidales bacterium]